MTIQQSWLKKKDKKNKKKRFQRHKQEHTGEREKKTQATDVNVTKATPKRKLKVKCFKCDKKNYYANDCTKPLKN